MLAFTKNTALYQNQGLFLLHDDKNHQVWAGPRASQAILSDGLSPDMVRVVTGAAGGSKTLCLAGLDQLLFGQWLKQASNPIHFIGASAGSWRMAACLTNDPAKNLKHIADSLADGCGYDSSWSSERLESGFRQIIESGIKGKESEIFGSKHSLSILVCKTTENLFKAGKYNKAAIFKMLIENALDRNKLGKYLNRVWIHKEGERRESIELFDSIPFETIDLNRDFLIDWLFASATLPGYFPGKPHDQGKSMLLDGGLIDIDLSYPGLGKGGIHLMPHFHSFVRLGWLDKVKFPAAQYRLAPSKNLENTLLICPTEQFAQSLPGKKIPCRKDLKSYGKNNALRFSHWTACKDQSQIIAEEFEKFLNRFKA